MQAGRLRLKLAEYYASEGAADPIVVKIPKGSYHLTFEARPVEPDGTSESSAPAAPAPSVAANRSGGGGAMGLLLLAGLSSR